MIFLTIIVFFILFFTVFYIYVTWNFNYWRKHNIPAQETGIRQILQKKHIAYVFDDLYNKFKGYPFIGTFMIRNPQLLILDPELIKKIFITNFNNFHDNLDFFDTTKSRILHATPSILKGEEWKRRRNEITPAFSTSRMKSMFPLIKEICERMINYMKHESLEYPGNGIETKELCVKFATDVVSNSIFAADAASFVEDKPIIREMGKYMFRPSLKFFMLILLKQLFPYAKMFINIEFMPKFVEEFFLKLMHDATKQRLENKNNRSDYLQYLINLKERKEITEEDMTSHAVTFFFSGFDTSSSLIASTLYQLAKNPDVQNKLRQEINEKICDNNNLSFDEIMKMQYLDQTINESLRIFPLVPFLLKVCTKDIEFDFLKDHKFLVTKGMLACVPIYSIHLDSDYYPDPLKFKPERFNAEHGGIKYFQDKGVFFPFGLGPRICIGIN